MEVRTAIKLAFVDLDGTVCNSEKRFEKAYRNGRIDWEVAFRAALLELDELLAHAPEALDRLEVAGWRVIFLSSRPQMLYKATKSWLKTNGLLMGEAGEREIILKPPKYRFSSSAKWKAEVICKRAGQADQILFFDDETENIVTVKGLWSSKGLGRELLKTFKSLKLIPGEE